MLEGPLEGLFPASEGLDLLVSGYERLAEVDDNGSGGAYVRVDAVVGLSYARVSQQREWVGPPTTP